MSDFIFKVLSKFAKLDPEQAYKFTTSVTKENEKILNVINSLKECIMLVDENYEISLMNRSMRNLLFPNSEENFLPPKEEVWRFVNSSVISSFIESFLKNPSSDYISRKFSISELGDITFYSVDIYVKIWNNKTNFILKVEDDTSKIIKDMRLRRAESMASLSGLLASVAHEIKNPLQSMSIYTRLIGKQLEQEDFDRKETKEYLEVIEEEIQRLSKTVNNFLFKAKSGNIILEYKNLNQIIGASLEILKHEIENKNIKIVTEFGNIRDLLLDERTIKSVITNIIKNAIEATGDKNEGLIEIRTYIDGNTVVLSIKDNGDGIPNEIQSRIFEPYFTTKPMGNGIGLALSYKIIKEHGGDLYFKSEEGEGTIFYVVFKFETDNEIGTADSNRGKILQRSGKMIANE